MTVYDAVSGTSQPAVRPGIAVPTFRIDFSREVDDPVFLTHASYHLTNDRSHSISRKWSELPRETRWMNSRLSVEQNRHLTRESSQGSRNWRLHSWNFVRFFRIYRFYSSKPFETSFCRA